MLYKQITVAVTIHLMHKNGPNSSTNFSLAPITSWWNPMAENILSRLFFLMATSNFFWTNLKCSAMETASIMKNISSIWNPTEPLINPKAWNTYNILWPKSEVPASDFKFTAIVFTDKPTPDKNAMVKSTLKYLWSRFSSFASYPGSMSPVKKLIEVQGVQKLFKTYLFF